MSGSSLDGLDITYCRLETAWDGGIFLVKNWELLLAETLPFSEEWQTWLKQMPTASVTDFFRLHVAFGHYLGELVNQFFAKNELENTKVDFIASHGHTILHEPSQGFTVQVGDGAVLATSTGCKVVCDFRTADVALGGQGAPLAPMADKMLFPGFDFYLNLGGIANITCNMDGRFVAFDVCGANQALNALANLVGQSYDKNGQLASSGQLNFGLFEKINAQGFFHQPYPKSLSNQWVQRHLSDVCLQETALPVNDRLHTVCQHIALQLERSVKQVLTNAHFTKTKYRLLATGGGAFNGYLMQCIQQLLPDVDIIVPSENLVKFKEALLMALLGALRLEGIPNCLASVTGASRDAVGGGVFLP